MKLDLQSLSAEPLIYMLMHSGAFVAVLGGVFFFIGLLFGRATWGRYKRQTRELRGEADAMKQELADLKRKLADHSVKAGPAVAMVTEMIQMPRRESTVSSTKPLSAEGKNGTGKPPQTPAAPVDTSIPSPEPPSRSRENVIKSRMPAHPELAAEEVSPALLGESAVPPAGGAPSVDNATLEASPSPARPSSALAAIIAPPASPKKDPETTLENEIPVLPEIPLPQAPVLETSIPEFDPELGLVYKSKPANSDDLTALKGIAQPLASRLQTLGVYTYEQIAGWTADQIRAFSTRLAFKDRIERELWVEQARELLATKHRPAV